jgi:hypothetical protein
MGTSSVLDSEHIRWSYIVDITVVEYKCLESRGFAHAIDLGDARNTTGMSIAQYNS